VTATDLALVLLALAVLPAIVRVVRGPTATDRVVAAEITFVVAVAVIVLLAVRLERPVLVDIALVAVLAGFIATVSLTRLIRRGGERS
jgi:multicomponent Na+:H+ antiporter subunit F